MAPGSGDGVVCDNFTSWKTEKKKKFPITLKI